MVPPALAHLRTFAKGLHVCAQYALTHLFRQPSPVCSSRAVFCQVLFTVLGVGLRVRLVPDPDELAGPPLLRVSVP